MSEVQITVYDIENSIHLFDVINYDADINIKNMIMNTNSIDTALNYLYVQNVGSNLNIKSLIITNGTKGVFYGSEFSRYYVSWKTGLIGLKSMGGNGSFQGSVSQDWLLNYKKFSKLG